MKRWSNWVIIGALVLAMIALVGWASAYTPLLTPSASEAWSRGRLIGVTPVSNPVDIQAAPGGGVFLAWVDLDDRLHVARLGTRGQVVVDRTPGLGADAPREPRFLVSPEGEIHLIWRETGEGRSLLMYARLDSAASVQVDPFLLSMPGDEARSPRLAFNQHGGIEVFWTGQAGIYHVTLDTLGEEQGEPVLLIEQGEEVSVQVGQGGIFHLAWLQRTGPNRSAVYYAFFDPRREELSRPEEADQVFLRSGQRVESLVVGLDHDTGYVLWIIQDLRDVSSWARYAFFPLEIPRQKKVRDLRLDGGVDPLSPWVVRGQYDRSLVAVTQTIMTQAGPQLQVGIVALHPEQLPAHDIHARAGDWAFLAARMGRIGASLTYVSKVRMCPLWRGRSYPDQRVLSGRAVWGYPSFSLHLSDEGLRSPAALDRGDWPEGQYIITASDRPSLKPSVAVDAQSNLHLAWLETGGFGAYRVAYASTASGVKRAYNAVTLWDVVDKALDVAMQLFLAVGLAPVLAVVWSLLPLMWLIGYHMVTGHEYMTAPGARAAFGVAILLEVACTYLISPYRGSVSAMLYRTLPLATAAAAFALVVLYLRRRDESLFGAFFVFALVHGLLQVVIGALLRV